MQPQAKLDELPFELLGQIATSLDHAQSLRSLSITCRNLHKFVAEEGWYAFVSSHFPGYKGPPLWRDAAHSLTSLSKAWERRAFNNRFILPIKDLKIRHIRTMDRRRSSSAGDVESRDSLSDFSNARPPVRERNRRPAGQTMGYHPVLDCAERWQGGSWTDKEEVLVVGAGAEVLVRSRCIPRSQQTGTQSALDVRLHDLSLNGDISSIDDHGHKSYWRSWRGTGLKDGPDDISTLKILDNDGSHADELIVGRASGSLQRVKLGDRVAVMTSFATQGRPVLCMDYLGAGHGLLAVGLGARDIALYNTNDDRDAASPFQVFPALCHDKSARTRATRFLSSTRLAIGHGLSQKPLDVYELRPEGVSEQPLRRFPALREKMYGQTASSSSNEPSDAVYSIAPLPAGSLGSEDGQIFASGWYSGAVRLHDMRSPEPAVTTFADPLEAGASVYSVLPVSMDRIVAGTALHAKMQVYEIRSPRKNGFNAPGFPSSSKGNSSYSLFLARDYKSARKESSIYSMVMSSPYSSTIYAGLQGSVMQMDLFASTDRYPDSIYRTLSDRKSQSRLLERNYASCAMMDHNGPHQLLIQRGLNDSIGSLLDDRWMSLV